MCLTPHALERPAGTLNNNSTISPITSTPRAFHDTVEPLAYVVLHLVSLDRSSSFYKFLDKLTTHSGREAQSVRHLTIDVDHPNLFNSGDYFKDIEGLLCMLPGLHSFTITDTGLCKASHRLLDLILSPLPPTLRKLQVAACAYNAQRFSSFLSLKGKLIEHLEVHPRSDFLRTSPLPFLPLSSGALPALRILGANTLDSVFHNLGGVRNLTHIKLSPDGGMGLNTIFDFQEYARSLVNVTTLACSASDLGIFHAAGMLPSLERLDVCVVGDIDDLWYEPLVIHTSPGYTAEFGGLTECARMRRLKMLRLTSQGKVHSHAFVQWAFKRFPGLRSLELPYLSKEASNAIAESRLDVQSFLSPTDPRFLFAAHPCMPAHTAFPGSYKLGEVKEPGSFYRFANGNDMPSLIRWKCRKDEEWFHDWTRDVEVVVDSVSSEEYSLAPASSTFLLHAMNF